MNNKKITFILWIILLIMIITLITIENVFASEITLNIATVNGNNVGNNQNGSYTDYTYGVDQFFDVNIGTITDSMNGSYDYSFKKYPYVMVYFKTAITDFRISRTTSCNTSCFSPSYIVKNLGKTDYSGYDYYQYVLILPVNKYQTSNPMTDYYIYQVQDVIRFTQKQSGSSAWLITNITLTDDISTYTNESTDLAIINMQNVISGSLNTLNNSIDQGWANFQTQDLDNSDKVPPGTQEFSEYEDIENDLFDAMNNADISDMNIAIDGNSSTWVWNRITEWLNSNSLIMSFFISILSVGIIKMALGR